MTTNRDHSRAGVGGRARATRAPLLALWLAISVVGCDSLIEVENPNNVRGEDLENPTAASAIANGALYTMSRGFANLLAVYGSVTDELTWIGSRDAWGELNEGFPTSPFNEFSDAAFPFIAEGRWMGDEAIKLLEGFDAAGELKKRTDLARAYLYAALAYTMIGDAFDDFALSDRRVAAAPLGEAGMSAMFTTATGYLDLALTVAQAEGDVTLQRDILAARAHAKHGLAVWNLVGIRPISTANNGLVSDAGAVADAGAALALDDTDWRFQVAYGASTVFNEVGWQVNGRLELRLGPTYFTADAAGKRVTAPAINDLIDGTADPALAAFLDLFTGGDPSKGTQYASMTMLSAREMHLIIAESEFATGGDNAAFRTAINDLRDFDGLTDYTGQVVALDLFKQMRATNTYLQGRRLSDLYRYGEVSPHWRSGSTASTTPGSFLPITRIEIEANCHINPEFDCPSGQ